MDGMHGQAAVRRHRPRLDGQHHRIEPDLAARLGKQVLEALRILGPRELLAEAMQAKAVVDALVEDAAQLLVALDDQHIAQALVPSGVCRGDACRAAADHHEVVNLVGHVYAPLFAWESRT